MSTTAILTEIMALPPELRQEVEDFIAFLRTKKQQDTGLKERQFGYASGKVRLADDFDESLADFSEYM